MIIENGIAYPEIKSQELEVCGIEALDNHLLWVRFSNGETKTIDFKPLLKETCFKPLQNKDFFKRVYLDYGVPSWNNGEIDISPQFLYEKC